MSDYIIGLTGGVASGKSAVEKRFRAMGVTVADADAAAAVRSFLDFVGNDFALFAYFGIATSDEALDGVDSIGGIDYSLTSG